MTLSGSLSVDIYGGLYRSTYTGVFIGRHSMSLSVNPLRGSSVNIPCLYRSTPTGSLSVDIPCLYQSTPYGGLYQSTFHVFIGRPLRGLYRSTFHVFISQPPTGVFIGRHSMSLSVNPLRGSSVGITYLFG